MDVLKSNLKISQPASHTPTTNNQSTMGQSTSTTTHSNIKTNKKLNPHVLQFSHLPRPSVEKVYETFNDIAEGYALTLEEFLELFENSFMDDEFVNVQNRNKLINWSRNLFEVMDDDCNGRVDSFSLLSSLALISGMSKYEKVKFVIELFDLEDKGSVSLESVLLCMRTVWNGVRVLLLDEERVNSVKEKDLDQMAYTAFGFCIDKNKGDELNSLVSTEKDGEWISVEKLYDDSNFITIDDFVHFVVQSPELGFWLYYLDSFDDLEATVSEAASSTQPELYAYSPSNDVDLDLNVDQEVGGIPNVTIRLNRVYGYNYRNAKQNVVYVDENAIIFPAGKICVKQITSANSDLPHRQSFYKGHSNYVSCLTVCRNTSEGTIVATGQKGTMPFINIWSSNKMSGIGVLSGFYKSDIQFLKFSPSGNLLLASSAGDRAIVTVYSWRQSQLIYSSSVNNSHIFDASFLGTDDSFGICGKNFISFWSKEVNEVSFMKHDAIMGRKLLRQSFKCLDFFGEKTVCGTECGSLSLWDGRTCVGVCKGYNYGSIDVVSSNSTSLYAGTNEGNILVWNTVFELEHTFDINKRGFPKKIVSSLDISFKPNRFLVGLSSSEIFEFDREDGSISSLLVKGHCGEAGGTKILAYNSNEDMVVTAGKDRSIRIWNDDSLSSIVKELDLESTPSCIAINSRANYIAVAFGEGKKCNRTKTDGLFQVRMLDDFSVVHQSRDSMMTLCDSKFSADSKLLAFASLDKYIYIYNAIYFTKKFAFKTKRHGVMCFDFGHRDSSLKEPEAIRVLSWKLEISYWDLAGEEISSKADEIFIWETDSCEIMVVDSQGFREDKMKVLCHVEKAKVLGRLDGSICIFDKSASTSSEFRWCLSAHAGPISAACTTITDKLWSVGDYDNCLFQWKYETFDTFSEAKTTNTPSFCATNIISRDKNWDLIMKNDNSHLYAIEESTDEENFAPSRQWHRAIVAPGKDIEENLYIPNDELELVWIHGFGGARSRGGVFYGGNGRVIFFVGKTVVIYNGIEKQQVFYKECRDEIKSLVLNPNGVYCAAGQAGDQPGINVFDVTTLETKQVLHGFHKLGVVLMDFDTSGKMLVTLGADKMYSIAVYDWSSSRILFTSHCNGNRPFCLAFLPLGQRFVTCGAGFIHVWEIMCTSLQFVPYCLENEMQRSFVTIGYIGNAVVTGTDDGYLFRFDGANFSRKLKAHSSPIVIMNSSSQGVVTGSEDGLIKIWGLSMECKLTIDIRTQSSESPITSLYWSVEFEKLLVGTQNNEIWEVSPHDGSLLNNGLPLARGLKRTYAGGLDTHPFLPEFISVGEDKTLRVWDVFKNTLIRSTELEMPSTSCTYSPNGKMLAIGFGSRTGCEYAQFSGKWAILDEKDFSFLYEARDSTSCITEIKWSPNSKRIVTGALDGRMFIYSLEANCRHRFLLSHELDIHKSYISALDFSCDSCFVRSTCGAFELHYFETDSGVHIQNPSKIRDTQWSSQTCPYGWDVQGVWPRQNDGTLIQSVDCNFRSNDQNIIVCTGDNYGRLRLYRYPALSYRAPYREYHSHHGCINRAKWLGAGSHLITLGSEDDALMIWKHTIDDIAILDYKETKTDPATILEHELNLEIKLNRSSLCIVDTTAARPWRSSILEPNSNKWQNRSTEERNKKIRLIQSYGFQGLYTRDSVKYSCHNTIIYPLSSHVASQTRFDKNQSFYGGHESKISTITVTKDRRIVASGEFSSRPKIHLWDSGSNQNILVLKEFHRQGILSLSFSTSSKYLVSLGGEYEHTLVIWYSLSGEWRDAILQAKVVTGSSTFAKFIDSESSFHLMSGGSNLTFYKLEGERLTPYQADFGPKSEKVSMLTACSFGSRSLTGSVNGKLHIWNGRTLEKCILIHDGAVLALEKCLEGLCTSSMSCDVKVWSSKLELLKKFSTDSPVISLDFVSNSLSTTTILLGLISGKILELSFKTASFNCIHESHSFGELWGLATHPFKEDIFVTCGDDGALRQWQVNMNNPLKKLKTKYSMRCVAWSSDGKMLLVGCGGQGYGCGQRNNFDGTFLLVDSESFEIMFQGRDSNYWIRDVKFSPDLKTFALASMDRHIYIYENDEAKGYKLRATAEKNKAGVLSIDFSKDSYVLQSSSLDYELNYHETDGGESFYVPAQIRKLDWETYSCIFGWHVQGIWPKVEETKKLGEPTCASRSSDEKYLATGNSLGFIKIYDFPASSREACCISQKAHVGEVSRCAFTCSGEYLITLGKTDRAIMTWKVEDRDA